MWPELASWHQHGSGETAVSVAASEWAKSLGGMAWIFGGRKSPRGSRAPPPPYPQQPSEEQKLEQMLIQQQLLQSQQPQPQHQHRHAGTGSGTPAPHPLQPHQHQPHRGAPPPYQQPPAHGQQPPSGAGTQQQTASVKRLRYQALDRIDVVLAPEMCAERDAMLSQMDALKCLQVDIAERRARYPAIDLSLERSITKAAEDSLVRRSEQDGAAAAHKAERLAREESATLTESLRAIAAMQAAEEKEREQAELAAINKRISEMEAAPTSSSSTPAASPGATGPRAGIPSANEKRLADGNALELELAQERFVGVNASFAGIPSANGQRLAREESEEVPMFVIYAYVCIYICVHVCNMYIYLRSIRGLSEVYLRSI